MKRRINRRPKNTTLLCTLLSLTWLGCSSGPYLDEESCPFKTHASQENGKTMRCGTLNTYENHDKRGRMIQVPYLLFKTQAVQSAEAKSIVAANLAGGPGQSWNDLGLNTIEASDSANFIRDNVFVEQRGTGISQPKLGCSVQKSNEDDRTFIERCVTNLRKKDIDPEAYNTVELAKDVEDLRRLLGYKKLMLNGVSYGTAWAIEILRQNSKNVAAAVLDSVVTPTIAPFSESASIDDRALGHLFEECASNGPCSAAYGDVEATMTETLQLLAANPAAIKNSKSTLTADDFFYMVVNQLEVDPMADPLLIKEIHDQVVAGTPLELATQDNPFEGGGLAGLALGQYISVACSDSQHVTLATLDADRAKVREAFRPYASDVSAWIEICSWWPYKKRDLSAFSAVQSDVQTLVLTADLDVRTPPEWGIEAASTLPNSVLIRIPGIGHDVAAWGVPCVDEMRGAFVRSLQKSSVDTSCITKIDLDFVLPDEVTREPHTWTVPCRQWQCRLPHWQSREERGVTTEQPRSQLLEWQAAKRFAKLVR